MTNLKTIDNHNILGSASARSAAISGANLSARRRSEGGYTLVALLAMMTILALFAMAVAPRAQQQAQREREQEAIFRGEQVAEAIRQYYGYRAGVLRVAGDQALPSSMDHLLAGIPVAGGAKNRQILRASAARDPLTIEGEWRFVYARSQELTEFQQSLLFFAENSIPSSRDPEMTRLQQFAVPPIVSATNIGSPRTASSTSSAGDGSSGPFVGVASRSRKDSVLTYYGIERHDQWIFTPLFR